MVELPRKAKGERPVYLDERAVDKLLSMVLNLAGEVVVLRERLDSAERLLEERLSDDGGKLRDLISQYRPSPDVIAERETWRANFLDMVMGSLRQDHQALEEAQAPVAYASVVELVSIG